MSQISAKFPGVCKCGATVGPEDRIEWNGNAIEQCIMCGLKDCRYQGPRKGVRGHAHRDPGCNPNGDRRYAAQQVALAILSVERWTARLAKSTTDADKAKFSARVEQRKTELAERRAEVQAMRGPKWTRPSERDIELALEKMRAEEARRMAEEAEEA